MASEEAEPLLGSPKGGTSAARTLAWNFTIYITLTLFLDAHQNLLAPNLTVNQPQTSVPAPSARPVLRPAPSFPRIGGLNQFPSPMVRVRGEQLCPSTP